MKRLYPILTALIAALFLTSCVKNTHIRQEPQANYELRINQNSREDLFIDDIGINLRPIMSDRIKNTEAYYMKYQYWNPSNSRNNGIGKKLMFSLPAFEVQVTNTTKFSIQFQKTTARLVDDAGNTYDAVIKQDVSDSMRQYLDSVESRGWQTNRSAALESTKSLRIFDKNYESLPSITEKRILSFEMNSKDSSEYQKFLASTKYLRVILFNVPVKFDQAGNVIKAEKFEYLFDVVRI